MAPARTPGRVGFLLACVCLGLAACGSDPPVQRRPSRMSGRWVLTGPMNVGRTWHSLTLLDDGRVLAAGGCVGPLDNGSCPYTATAELYDPATGIWAPTGPMNVPRAGHGVVLLPGGKVLVAGGDNLARGSAELYDPATGTWTRTTGGLSARRSIGTPGNGLVPFLDGSGNVRVLFAGGLSGPYPESQTAVASADLYDPGNESWSQTRSMMVARAWPTAILLPSGKVLVVGGAGKIYPSGTETGLSSAEIYDPKDDSWALTGEANRPVDSNTLTLLPTGEVLLAAGYAEWPPVVGASPHAALYAPGRGEWRAAHPAIRSHGSQTAVRLASGRVLITDDNNHPEIYDPWLDAWSEAPPMLHHVDVWPSAVLLASGAALVTGGSVYDPFGNVDAFSVTASQLFLEWEGSEVPP